MGRSSHMDVSAPVISIELDSEGDRDAVRTPDPVLGGSPQPQRKEAGRCGYWSVDVIGV